MNCRECRTLLYLNREGELTEAEARAVAAHCATCRKCAEEKAAVDAVSGISREARALDVSLRDPEDLMRRILDRTSVRGSSSRLHSRISPAGRFLDFVLSPGFRWASCGVVTVAVTFFLAQSFIILGDVQRLETQQALRDHNSLVPQIAYVVDTRPLEGTPAGMLLGQLEGSGRGILVLNDRNADTWRGSDQTSAFRFVRNSHAATGREALPALVSFIRSNARPTISFSKEGA